MYTMHSKSKSSMQLNQSTYVPIVIANIANIYVHERLQFLFDTYGHITPTDLSNNSDHIKLPWVATTPFEMLIDQMKATNCSLQHIFLTQPTTFSIHYW